MNKIIIMIGTMLLTFLIILIVMPSYEKMGEIRRKKKEDFDFELREYNLIIITLTAVLSIMINFLVWGWFL